MDWLIGFVLGFVADLFRSVFMPASTDWINRFIPTARRKANVEENILTLEIMDKLKSLGKDPALVKHARDDAAQFLTVLTSQREAFVENAIEIIGTQAEMNMEAGLRGGGSVEILRVFTYRLRQQSLSQFLTGSFSEMDYMDFFGDLHANFCIEPVSKTTFPDDCPNTPNASLMSRTF